MKKALLIIVVTILSLFSAQLYSAEPLVRFYLQDGSSKQYNLSEIDNIKFPNAPETLQLQVFTNDGKTYYYPAQLIDTITFSIGQYSNQYINLWHDGFKWDFAIHKIDSISIYYTPYVAVTIGTQHWMYRNLNVDHYRNGDLIPEIRDSTAWAALKTGAWCFYDNNPVNGVNYGKLYNWYAVNDPRGLTPKGWHVPSEDEWSILEVNLGSYLVAGAKLKEVGWLHWLNSNPGATNESGFTALGGGYRRSNEGFDYYLGYFGIWWTSTLKDSNHVWFRLLICIQGDCIRIFDTMTAGFSVRCVRDF